ncbi:hypothetical protein [Streptomyces sp. NPDC058280]|uniref:hypothetical protein n=1 Tax=Streptomyces sp. NPDC058280 TaxID=3346419 RepID=UPI0036EA9D8A
MTYTLAEAIRAQFERDHPGGKNTLLCVGLCRRRKDREDFRETPWHGRAASCRSCEGGGWDLECAERQLWRHEQTRGKLRAYQRYAHHLKFRLLLASTPKSGDVLSASVQPYYELLERSRRKWSLVISEALSEAHTQIEEERWQSPRA